MEKKTAEPSLAEEQTNWAHERTRLAKERTFASWLRTGLSATAVGLALIKILPSVEPQWLLHVIGFLFVGAGCIVFVMGYRTYHIVIKKLEKEGFRGIPSALMGVLTSALLLGAILGLILILLD